MARLSMGVDERGGKYFIDTTTRNISFLQTAQDLAAVGVKNNKFFLALYNRDLVGVDPYDPALSKGMVDAVITECIINPYYYLRELARVPEQGGSVGVGGGSPYVLHRGNLAATFCFTHNIDHYLILPRQCFKTHSILAILVWTYLFGTTNSQMNFMNKAQGDSDANLAKFKAQKALLPKYIQQAYNLEEDSEGNIKMVKGTDNVRTIRNPVTLNWIESKPSARTEEAADGIGRGNSAPIQWSDETEFTNYMGTIIAASGPAYVRAAENARRNNAIHCRIFTTTPGNIDSEPVESTMPTRENAALFTESFYDWKKEQVSDYMLKNSRNGICYIEFQYRQIGMNEDYFRQMVNVLEGNKTKIKREVLLQRIRGANDSPFDEEDLDAINDNRKAPLEEIVVSKGYILYCYEKIQPDVPYIISVDPATGAGVNADNTAINIIDTYTLRSIAVLKTPYSDVVETGKIITELAMKHIHVGPIVIERNSIGSAVIALMVRTPLAARLYYDSSKLLEETGEAKLDSKGYVTANNETRRYWGVATQNKNREIMTKELLPYMVKEHKDRFIARELIDDLNNLYVKASGRIEARPRTHDDVVMSYLIGIYVYEHGKNLHQWGIIKGAKRYKNSEERREASYSEIYAEMPDSMKEMFNAPGSGTMDMLQAQRDAVDGFVSGSANNDIYRRIQQAHSFGDRDIVQNDGTHVKVSSNIDPDQMISNAMENDGDISDDTFDIINIINGI